MKIKLPFLLAISLTIAIDASAQGRGTRDEYLLDKIKKIFAKPTPTPTPKTQKRKKKATPAPSPAASASPVASPPPSETASPAAPRATASPSVTPTPSPSPTPTALPRATASPSITRTPSTSPTPAASLQPTATPTSAATTPAATLASQTTPPSAAEQWSPPTAISPATRRERQLLEPVRPISPGPGAKFRVTASPLPATTPPPAAMSPLPKAVAVPVGRPTVAPNAGISSTEIAGYENYPSEVRRVIDFALGLTNQNLSYKYGSADPANGGMDCSGFIYYVLSKSGLKDVPRDAREQYVWVRKAGNFQAVLAHRDDTFELDALKPGDLLFWAGTSTVNRDPDITQTMVYLGRDKATNQRVMVGASEGRTYKGRSHVGVSIFDFKVAQLSAKSRDSRAPVFVGYGRIPGLRAE